MLWLYIESFKLWAHRFVKIISGWLRNDIREVNNVAICLAQPDPFCSINRAMTEEVRCTNAADYNPNPSKPL